MFKEKVKTIEKGNTHRYIKEPSSGIKRLSVSYENFFKNE